MFKFRDMLNGVGVASRSRRHSSAAIFYEIVFLISIFVATFSVNSYAEEIRSYADRGRCLDVQWGNSANYTPIWMYDCNQTEAQQWFFESLFYDNSGSDGRNSRIYNALGWKVLNPDASGATNLYSDTGASDQHWRLENTEIRSAPLVEACMTSMLGTGTKVYLAPCRWDLSYIQKWIVDSDSRRPRGAGPGYPIRLKSDPSKCLDILPWDSTVGGPSAGENACNAGVNSQFWWINYDGASLRTRWNGREYCLDLKNNTWLPVYPCDGSIGQQFYFRSQIVHSDSGRCLQLPTPYLGGGRSLPVLGNCTGADIEQWIVRWFIYYVSGF